jgi:hypothetical protein
MAVKERDEQGEETGERVIFFRAVPVFDVAQTDGEPLPEPPCEPDHGRLSRALHRAARGSRAIAGLQRGQRGPRARWRLLRR